MLTISSHLKGLLCVMVGRLWDHLLVACIRLCRPETMEHGLQCLARLIRVLLGQTAVADNKLACGRSLCVLGVSCCVFKQCWFASVYVCRWTLPWQVRVFDIGHQKKRL